MATRSHDPSVPPWQRALEDLWADLPGLDEYGGWSPGMRGDPSETRAGDIGLPDQAAGFERLMGFRPAENPAMAQRRITDGASAVDPTVAPPPASNVIQIGANPGAGNEHGTQTRTQTRTRPPDPKALDILKANRPQSFLRPLQRMGQMTKPVDPLQLGMERGHGYERPFPELGGDARSLGDTRGIARARRILDELYDTPSKTHEDVIQQSILARQRDRLLESLLDRDPETGLATERVRITGKDGPRGPAEWGGATERRFQPPGYQPAWDEKRVIMEEAPERIQEFEAAIAEAQSELAIAEAAQNEEATRRAQAKVDSKIKERDIFLGYIRSITNEFDLYKGYGEKDADTSLIPR